MTARKLFYKRRGKKYFKDRVKNWIERSNKSELLVSIIQNADPAELIDSNGQSVLHIAAMFNNITIIQSLTNSEFELDVVNSYGKTALMIAVSFEHVEAMKLLISANADLFITDRTGKSPLELLLENAPVDPKILQIILVNMKTIYDNDKKIIEKLIEAGFDFAHIVELRDAELTKCFLAEHNTIERMVEEGAVITAMDNFDEENVRVLLYFGDRLNNRRLTFLHIFCRVLYNWPHTENLLEVIHNFCRIISDWKFLNKKTVCTMGEKLAYIPEKMVHLVLQSNIYPYVKQYFTYDLLLDVFGNPDPKIIKWIQNQPFDIHSTNTMGETALHIAVKRNVVDNIKYLLNIGVDPHITDKNGHSAIWNIFYAFNGVLPDRDEGIQFLLLHYPDLHAENDFGKAIFNMCTFDPNYLIEFNQSTPSILAHFAMLEAHNIPINKFVEKCLNVIKSFHFYERYCKQLEILKMKKFSEQLTFFDVLTTNIEEICRQVNVEHSFAINEILDEQNYNQYYIFLLKKRIEKAILIKKLRIKAIDSIGNSIPALQSYYPVLHKIVRYLGDDLFHMFK